jgi:hypothetical protein
VCDFFALILRPFKTLAKMALSSGMLAAFTTGLACAAFLHESKFGCAWERQNLMVPLQRIGAKIPGFSELMWALGQFCSSDFLVPYFAFLYWVFSQELCIYGIWLVPISETTNGLMKWYFQVPRPGWVDSSVEMKVCIYSLFIWFKTFYYFRPGAMNFHFRAVTL